MAPMQWRDATVGGKDTTGFEAFSSQIRQEPDVRQVQVGNIGQTGEVSVATQNQFMVAGPVVSRPGGGQPGGGQPGGGQPGG